MTTLAPVLQQGVRFDQPVAEPSIIGSVAGLANIAVQATKPQQASQSEINRQRDLQLNQGLLDGLSKAAALRQQGQEDAALRLERQTKLNFARQGGDLADPGIGEMVRTVTGEEIEGVGFSPDEQMREQLLTSEDYPAYYAAARAALPNGTEEEWQQRALTGAAMAQANAAMIQQTKVNWNTRDGQRSRIAAIELWEQSHRGALAALEEQGVAVTNDVLNGVMIDFLQFKAQVANSRPAGISGEEWKPVQDALDAQEAVLGYLIEMTSTEELSADAVRGFVQGAQVLQQEGEITDMQYNVFITAALRDPQFLTALQVGDMKDIAEAVLNIDVRDRQERAEAGNKTDIVPRASETFTPKELEVASESNPRVNFRKAQQQFSAAGVANEEWVDFVSAGTANLYKMAADHSGWIDGQGYAGMFSPQFFHALDELKGRDQFQYNSVVNKSKEAIEANETAVRAGIASRTENDIVRYNPQLNVLTFDRAALDAYTGISNLEKQRFLDLVDTKYGGDINAALKDRGSGLSVIKRIAEEFADPEVTDRIRALDQLNSIKQRFDSIEAGGGEEVAAGGQGEDFLTAATGQELTKDLIRGEEGFRNNAYWDVNAWRAGYGSDTTTRADGTVERITESSIVTREDAERDLARRSQEFATVAGRQVGTDVWTSLPGNVTAALTSVAYNYGSLPSSVVSAVKGGDIEAMAAAVEGLSANPERRRREAALIRGQQLPPSAGPIYTQRPFERPETLNTTPLAERPTAQAPEATVRPQERPVERAQSTPEGGTTGEPSKASQEAAQRVWGALEDSTKSFLLRLFGTEEEVVRALASKELNEEDLK